MSDRDAVYVGESYQEAYNEKRGKHYEIMERNARAAAEAGFSRFRFSDEEVAIWDVGRYYTPTVSLTEKVAAYLASPDRSESTRVNSDLTRLGFWKAMTDDRRERILETLLASPSYCDEGKDRFREAVGLPKKELYPGRPDLTKAVEVELLMSEGGNPRGWIDTVNEALDVMEKHRFGGSMPRARFRTKESK